jgi:hypothetical protein
MPKQKRGAIEKVLVKLSTSGSGLAEILGVLELNVCAKHFIEHFSGFWLGVLCIRHGLFDADDLVALRALAEAMTGVIHFVPWSKPPHVG